MKLMLIVETPADEDLHWPRIETALHEYCAAVRANNQADFGTRTTDLGCDGGPNTLIASNGARVTERRVDLDFFLLREYDDALYRALGEM